MTNRMITPTTPNDSGHGADVAVQALDNDFIVRANVPNLRPEDLHIEVQGNTVTVHAQVQEESRQEGDLVVLDRHSTQFSRTITLPAPVDPNGAQAVVTNGVLTLRLPRTDVPQPKAITVKSTSFTVDLE